MALGIEQKQQIVAEVSEVAASALSAVLADYRGLTVAEMTEMRVKARESGVYLRVVEIRWQNEPLKVPNMSALTMRFGPTLLAFLRKIRAPRQLLKDYAKDLEDLEIKALSIGGEFAADRLIEWPNCRRWTKRDPCS